MGLSVDRHITYTCSFQPVRLFTSGIFYRFFFGTIFVVRSRKPSYVFFCFVLQVINWDLNELKKGGIGHGI